jgi:hypothetical protein
MAACRGSLELANGSQRGPGGGLVATLVFEPASGAGSSSVPEGE